MQGVWKISIFDQYLTWAPTWYKIGHSYYEMRVQETVSKLSNGTMFNNLQRQITQISRSRHYLTLHVPETVRSRYHGILIGTYTVHTPYSAVLFRMILYDIEWHSEILNDTNATVEFLVDSVMLTSYFYFLQHGTQFTTPCSNYGELRNIIGFDFFSVTHLCLLIAAAL